MRSARAPAGSSARRVSRGICAAGPPATTRGTGARSVRTRSAPKSSTTPASPPDRPRSRIGTRREQSKAPGTDSRSNRNWKCAGADARDAGRSACGSRTANDSRSRTRRPRTPRASEKRKQALKKASRLPKCCSEAKPVRSARTDGRQRTGVGWRRTRGTRSVSRSRIVGAGPFPSAPRGKAGAGARRCGAPPSIASRTTRPITRRSSCAFSVRKTKDA